MTQQAEVALTARDERDEHLHHVLRLAVCGGLTRTAQCGRDGVRALRVDGLAATDNQRWWVSVADQRQWLVWLPRRAPDQEGAALSEAGGVVFARWERELWGPPPAAELELGEAFCRLVATLDDPQAGGGVRCAGLSGAVPPPDFTAWLDGIRGELRSGRGPGSGSFERPSVSEGVDEG